MGQKITPNIWCNGNAKEMADFYVSTFGDGKITHTMYYPTTKEEGLADFQVDLAGKELVIDFEVRGRQFSLINAGDTFKPNPSISFFIDFNPGEDEQAREHLDEMWQKLTDGGNVMMPLDKYPFSEYYGWVEDKFGVSWQLILSNPEGDARQSIVPSLLFSGDNTNRAEEALKYYVSVFENSKLGLLAPYEEDTGPAKKGSLMYGDCLLDGEWVSAMDSGVEMDAPFTEGVSLVVPCKDQAEIDYFWEKLSTVPESEQCGWCKDKFGVSWQIVPANMDELMKKPGAYANMMQMKKLVIADF
ncbi:MAG: VOC family protein [Candidatus Saccharimonadales bacterium]